jgi:hypothetical protein
MKPSIFFFAAVILVEPVYAAPDKRIVDSCLATEAVVPSIRYAKLNPTNYYEEDDSGTTSNTFKFEGGEIGTWESSKGKNFGLIYKGRKLRKQDFIKLGAEQPSSFDLTLAQWGIVVAAKEKYLCTAFNFEGLGQSGSFQNIRGVYIIDTKSRPTKAYYVVGDVRNVSK